MLKKILVALLVVIAVICIAASTRPDTFHVSRSATMSASPAAIYGNINNLKKWDAWSPWAKLDPNAKVAFAGNDSGVGSSMHWAGNMEVGEGTLIITETVPNKSVKYKLEFLKPLKGDAYSAFTLEPNGSDTNVTWSMEGKSSFMAKIMSLFVNCEKMMNEQFDKGLANLKQVVESK